MRLLRRRVRLLMVERAALNFASVGAAVTAAVVLLSTRYDALLNYTLWGGVFIISIVAGVAYGLLRRLDDLAVAIAADRRADLKERLSTAVAITNQSAQRDSEGMSAAVISDAEACASTIRPRDVFRHRFGVSHGVFAGSLALLLAVIIIPLLPVAQSPLRREEVLVMKQEGKKLVRIAKELDSQRSPDQKELHDLAKRLAALGRTMQTGRMSRKQAILKTQRLTKELQARQDKLAQMSAGKKSMSEARADMRKASEDLAKRMAENMSGKEKIPISEAMKKLPSDKRLAELARKEGPLTESEQRELEKAVSRYANPNANLPIPPELAEALAKLAENRDYQQAMELMQKLAAKLSSGKMSKTDEETLRKQLEQLAKALKGTDLDKLAKQMRENAEKLAKMSPEELKQLLAQMKEGQKLAKAGAG